MSIENISAHEIASKIVSKLADLSALENAPPRLEVVASVFIDRDPVVHALKNEVRVLHNKLGEVLKRL